MTATDELRRMLDEAGVEWGNVRNDGSESDYLTEWQFDGIQSYAVATEWAVGGGLSLETHRHHLTPAQAIAATVGDADLATENAKLRELCERMHRHIRQTCGECDGWYCSNFDEDNECCVYDTLARELGVEVPDGD